MPLRALAAVVGPATLVASIEAAASSRRPAPDALPPEPLVIDVNLAPERHLMLLPRIGPARARAIVAERTRGGPFRTIEELERVHGIGPHTVAGLRSLARAGGPSPRLR